MQYALLIYEEEANLAENWDAARRDAFYAEFQQFGRALRDAGAFVAAQRLVTTEAATTVCVRDGRTLTTDGPFAETKEALGGFYLIECADLDAALRWAARVPSARHGRVEVRPVR